jgi:hypothetical protein
MSAREAVQVAVGVFHGELHGIRVVHDVVLLVSWIELEL